MRKIDSKTAIHSSLGRRQNAQRCRRRSVVEGLEPRAMLSGVPQPAHVVIVMEENHDYSQIIGPTGSQNQMNAPYINSLAQQGALMTDSTAIEHPSEPNYLDLFSGSNQGVHTQTGFSGDEIPTQFSGITLPFTSPNLGAELLKAGDTFVSYSETLPYAGYDSLDTTTQGNFGAYARRHNPAVNWTDPNNPAGNLANNILPTSVNQPFSSFPTDFNQLPTVSLVVPNVADDMHDDPSATGIKKADTWLQTNLGAYAQWAQQNNSLLIVTWDENDSSAGNHIATIFYGPMVKTGQYNEAINHFNVLRTVDDMYGLTPTGAGGTAATPITDIFNPPALSATGTPATSTLGGTFTGRLATFTDTVDPNDNDPGDYTATIDWGDGTTTPGTVSGSGGAAGFSVTGTHSYASEGLHTATLTITDVNDGATATINPVVTADYSIAAVASTVSVAQGSTFNGAVATFTDLDPAGTAGEFTATVNWGDTSTATSASIVAADGMFSVVASHIYTQAGTDPLTVTIRDVGGTTATLSSQASVSSPHATYVTAVYEDVLGRAPDAGGLAYWTHQLDTGAPISSVAAAIGHSAEYYGNFVIKPDYLKLLGRAADATGLQYWTTQMLGGVTDQQLAAGFIASDEFFKNAGGTDLDWVDAVYTLLLERTADHAGETYWTGQLASLEKTESAVQARSQVAVGISTSQENNSNLINADYEHYLGRAADPQGLQFWLQQFAAGKTNEDVIAGFTGSAEYYKDKTGVNP